MPRKPSHWWAVHSLLELPPSFERTRVDEMDRLQALALAKVLSAQPGDPPEQPFDPIEQVEIEAVLYKAVDAERKLSHFNGLTCSTF
jgi:hypothetical protein